MSKIDKLLLEPNGRNTVCSYVNTTYPREPQRRSMYLVNAALNCVECANCPSYISFRRLEDTLNVKIEPVHQEH